MKGYFTSPKAPELEPHHQMQFNPTQETRWDESYTSADVHSVYSTVPIDRADELFVLEKNTEKQFCAI